MNQIWKLLGKKWIYLLIKKCVGYIWYYCLIYFTDYNYCVYIAYIESYIAYIENKYFIDPSHFP